LRCRLDRAIADKRIKQITFEISHKREGLESEEDMMSRVRRMFTSLQLSDRVSFCE
jgi:hypothetical protein